MCSHEVPTWRGALPGVLIAQGVADAVRILQEWAGDELSCGGSDFLGKAAHLSLRVGPHVELPAPAWSAHAAPAWSSR